MENNKSKYSIGELGRLSGVTPLRIRTWENRYGFPSAETLPSGHRRYDDLTLEKVVMVKTALDQGYKIGDIVKLSNDKLTDLIDNSGVVPSRLPEAHGLPEIKGLGRLIHRVRQGQEAEILNFFKKEFKAQSPADFMDAFMGPFFRHLGLQWQEGAISVAEEHFVSELAEYFMLSLWREKNLSNTGRPIILTTLPNEEHSLGLHMAAVVLTQAGHKVHFLGARLPLRDLKGAVDALNAKGVCLTITKMYDQGLASEYLKRLDQIIPEVPVVCGGSGAKYVEGARYQVIQSFIKMESENLWKK